MRFLASIPATRAILLAALWPLGIIAIPAAVLTGSYLVNWWRRNFGGVEFDQTHIMFVFGPLWQMLPILLGPPTLFLLACWLARNY